MKTLTLILAASLVSSLSGGIPEPDVIFFGTITLSPPGANYTPTDAIWTVSGNSESAASANTTVVVIEAQTFYLTRIPFETRHLADNTQLPATPNTLALTPALTPYTRSATVDGRTAYLPPSGGIFSFGGTFQGLVERIDLVIGESYNEWSQRYFGLIASGSADPDGDGLTNYQEYRAGTDPTVRTSTFRVKSFAPVSGGGYTFTWDSIVGRTYTIERTVDLQSWAVIGTSQAGTGAPLAFTDFPTGGARKLHYRIKVLPSQP